MTPLTMTRTRFRCQCGRSVSASADSESAKRHACSRCLAARAEAAKDQRLLTLRIHRPA